MAGTPGARARLIEEDRIIEATSRSERGERGANVHVRGRRHKRITSHATHAESTPKTLQTLLRFSHVCKVALTSQCAIRRVPRRAV